MRIAVLLADMRVYVAPFALAHSLPCFACASLAPAAADGRHFKHFYMVDASTGVERLAVVGEDSARQDRRYTYKAMEELGGFCFENGKAVSTHGWVGLVLQCMG
jgi:hypothetical protein